MPLSLIEAARLNSNKETLFSVKKDRNNVILENKSDKKIKINNKEIFSKYKLYLNEFHHMTIEVDGCSLTLRIVQ